MANLVEAPLSRRELVESRLYPNIKSTAQAAVVMQKAQSFGLCPTVVADNIIFVGGKPGLSAQLIASLTLRSGKYTYRILEKTAKQCRIEFFEFFPNLRESLGVEVFTMEMAQRAGLVSNPSWKKYPEAMLFSRCLTAGVRARCPDVLGGTPVYTMEELNPSIEVDAEGSPVHIQEAEVVETVNRADRVRDLMASTKTNPTRFLKYFKAENLESLSDEQLVEAVKLLEEKVAAGGSN